MKAEIFKKSLFRYKFSIVFALLLLVVFTVFLREHINPFFAIVNVALILTVLTLVAKIGNRLLRNILVVLVSSILSFSIAFAVLLSTPLALGNIASILETNFSEAVALPISFFIVVFICLLTTTILCFLAINELKRLFSKQVSSIVLLALIVFINVCAVLVPVYRNSGFISHYRKDLQEMPLQTIYAYSSVRSPLLYGDIFGLVVYLYEKIEFEQFKNIEKEFPKGVTFLGVEKSVPTIYLVIGESAYRGRMSLYGYDVETTPFLDSIARSDSSSIYYYDAISVANITRDAVRFALSFASLVDKEAFWKEKNIIDLANDAGYATSWLSNQGLAGLYDNYPSYIARSSADTYFESKIYKDDLDLLPLLDKYHEKDENNFIVMHLMGSHFPFSDRYDEVDDSYFEHNDTISEYDKSIHHTDRFLQSLYNYTVSRDESSIIVYFSDHGASPERGVHGLQHADVSEYEIPLVILTNNVNIDIDWIVDPYRRQWTRYINSLSLSYILAQLMGYSVHEYVQADVVYQSLYILQVDGTTVSYDQKKAESL